ncbi:dUTP diphosphatase [Corynebacterium aurimucosum]|uniref:dUTP diphosphatase n=1 Tax=Corynebacterium aurimucosum TaxID=169292 RepID=UPI00344EF6EA
MEVEGEAAYRPARAHTDDAGWDVRAAEDVHLKPGERALVSTGIKLGIPTGYCALALPRSGTAHKLGVTLNNAPGLIDAGYQGTVYVNLINHGDKAIVLHQGDRVAQLLIQPVTLTRMMPVDALTGTTQRGTGGHGSSGVN